MGLLRRILAGLAALLRPGPADRDLDDEVEHFFQEAVDALVARGVPPAEARRRVRLSYGEPFSARETVSQWGWEQAVLATIADVRIATRRLLRAPGFTAVVVATLALGIGSATAMFSVVRPVLIEPLGYPDPDRVVSIQDRVDDGSGLAVTFGTFLELGDRSRAFAALAVSSPWQPISTDGDRPERLRGLRVSAAWFDALGVPPRIGPGFDPAQDRPGGAAQVVLHDALWRSAYGADPAIVGRAVRLDDRLYTVVGVLPPDFDDATGRAARVWTLLQYDPTPTSFDTREWGHHLNLVGRVAPGLDPGDVEPALAAIAARPRADHPRPPWAAMDGGFVVRPLREAVTADARPTMLALVGSVALLLAIACANVAVLLLAWGARREGELAMRVALGAGRARVARQLLAESLVLAATGGALGVLVARGAAGLVGAFVPPDIALAGPPRVDGAAALFALCATTVVGVVVGLAPALTLSRRDLRGRMRGVGRNGHRRTRRTLVVAEVALALVLLVGAGLMTRSVHRLLAVPPGFDPEGIVAVQVHTTGLDDGAGRQFFARALEAVEAVPGVTRAAFASAVPLAGDREAFGLTFEEREAGSGPGGAADRIVVAPGLFETLGVPVLEGRTLEKGDVAGAPGAAVVSESLARRAFPAGGALGRRLRLGDGPWFRIVGVVGDVKQASLGSTDTDAVYVTVDQWGPTGPAGWIAVRVQGDLPASMGDALRKAVWSVEPNQAVLRVAPMEAVLTASEARRRFVLGAFRIFGTVALMLAAVGLYGVLSQTVAERMRELGVRSALGASWTGIVSLVVRQGLGLVLIGVSVGLAFAVLASRFLETLLFGVTPLDPATYAVTVGVLGAVATVACLVPAVRAGRADPLQALRAE